MKSATERPCFVHVGTHKTGTTALQAFLGTNDELLEAAGLFYPKSGRLNAEAAGQHNVALEMSGDERFDPALGTFADLLDEMRASHAPAACLSSEAFQFIHDRPSELSQLREGLRSAGYRPVVVIYLRDQCEYLESLYSTLVNHAFASTFRTFLGATIATGLVRHGSVRLYRFDYDALVEYYASVFGDDNTIVRGYVRHEDAAWHTRDFLTAIGSDAFESIGPATQPRLLNLRRGLLPLMHRLLRNAGAVASSETLRLIRQCEELESRNGVQLAFRPLDESDALAVRDRFAEGNRRVFERWGVLVEAATEAFLNERRRSIHEPAGRAARALLLNVESDIGSQAVPIRVAKSDIWA